MTCIHNGMRANCPSRHCLRPRRPSLFQHIRMKARLRLRLRLHHRHQSAGCLHAAPFRLRGVSFEVSASCERATLEHARHLTHARRLTSNDPGACVGELRCDVVACWDLKFESDEKRSFGCYRDRIWPRCVLFALRCGRRSRGELLSKRVDAKTGSIILALHKHHVGPWRSTAVRHFLHPVANPKLQQKNHRS